MKSALQMEAKIVDSIRPAKLLALYARGIITAPEFATSLLVEWIRQDDPAADLPAWSDNLPGEVRRSLDELLDQVRRADCRWHPFLFRPGGPTLESAATDATILRQICLIWATARSPEPNTPSEFG